MARRSYAVALLALGGALTLAASLPQAHSPQAAPRRVAKPVAPASGMITGVVLGARGEPLAGACVRVSGPDGAVSGMTSADGRYFLAGLRPGGYTLSYRACASAPREPGAAAPATATGQVVITGDQVTRLPPVKLRPIAQPAGAGWAARTPPRPTRLRRLPVADLARRARLAGLGGISGRVTDPAGHPIKNICVSVVTSFGSAGTVTSRHGAYNTSKIFPPGRYAVQFTPTCGPGAPVSAGNWAPQWYRNKYRQAAANKVAIKAGEITTGINAVMRRGGQITGVVTSRAGVRLSGVCVLVFTPNGKDVIGQARTARGKYRIDSLDAGSYRVQFVPCSRDSAPYLEQWWRGASRLKASRLVKVRLATLTPNIDAALALGGKITGTVRFKNRRGRPLSGICVFGSGLGAVRSVQPDAATGKNGSYVMEGLPTGRYSLLFGPGCDNNGNFLFQNYPHPVRATAGHVTSGVNAYLQPGGTISGTVKAAADGKPLRGICVFVNDSLGDGTLTGQNGSYRLAQIPPGRYSVEFSGGCGNAGSYAPQWFPGKAKQFNAALVTIRASRVTSGINASMRPGATITGTVMSAAGTRVSGICVTAVDPATAGLFGLFGFTPGDTQTNGNGGYRLPNLAAGQYQVVFFPCLPGRGYVQQWFLAAARQSAAGLLDVPAEAVVAGVNASLARAGVITGTLRNGAGHPLRFGCVTVTGRQPGQAGGEVQAGSAGRYVVTGLAPGRYTVKFSDCGGTGYASRWYAGKTSPRSATPVTVTAGHVTTRIDGALTRGSGSISGLVTASATGKPVAGVCVGAASARSTGGSATDRHGHYVIRHLASGTYHLVFSSCDLRGPYPLQARQGIVRVSAPGAVTGVGYAVSPGGSISGTVLGGSPAPTGQQGVCVVAMPVRGLDPEGFAVTTRGGRYLIGHLAAGGYLVLFTDQLCTNDTQGLAPQWYDDQPTSATATIVAVTSGQASTAIDATLAPDGTITGTVTGPAPADTPLTGVCVQALPLGAAASPVDTVTAAGSYTLTGVVPGKYLVEFSSGCGAASYVTQWYSGATSRSAATPVTVSAGTVTSGIDAH